MATQGQKVVARYRRRYGKGPTFIQRSRAESAEQKALYHHVLGAGKVQRKRQFFDVSQADLDAITTRLDVLVSRRIAASS